MINRKNKKFKKNVLLLQGSSSVTGLHILKIRYFNYMYLLKIITIIIIIMDL